MMDLVTIEYELNCLCLIKYKRERFYIQIYPTVSGFIYKITLKTPTCERIYIQQTISKMEIIEICV